MKPESAAICESARGIPAGGAGIGRLSWIWVRSKPPGPAGHAKHSFKIFLSPSGGFEHKLEFGIDPPPTKKKLRLSVILLLFCGTTTTP
jgi:hypothetical protein